jgi:hypothetical protein
MRLAINEDQRAEIEVAGDQNPPFSVRDAENFRVG